MTARAQPRRPAHILRVLARHALAHLLARRAGAWPWLARRVPLAARPAPERVRRLFEEVGGTFVKFGQMLALQPDILALPYCNALFDLLDRIEPVPYAEIRRIVAEDLGRPPEEVFDAFEPQPLATASVGQVHVAWRAGRKLAVKVQRPQAEAEFSSDLRLMALFLRAVQALRLKPLYWLIEPMSEFVTWTREELDYRHEAAYSERLRRLPLDPRRQRVPEVLRELSTRRVLAVEFLEGATLLAYLRASGAGDDVALRRFERRAFERGRFAAHVVDNFLGNAFELGIYHADLHPANLMVLDDSVVGYIDFGITGVLSRYARRHLMLMTLALAQGDLDALADEFLRITVHGPGSDLEGFRRGLRRLAAGWYEPSGQGRRLRANFTRIMGEMLELSRRTDVMPERDIVKYIRSSIAIDGLITRFAPDFDLASHLAATCARQMRSQLRHSAWSTGALQEWSDAAGRLLRDGPARGARALDRLAAGELPVSIALDQSAGEAASPGGPHARALRLGGTAFGAALLLVLGPADARLGFNLATAEAALAITALTLLLGGLWRAA